jgi:mevalonate kinase
MNQDSNIFYSKILLFGEYSVIYNSMGLSIPYSHFRGELDFIGRDKYTDLNFARESNKLLRNFADHLKKLLLEKDLPFGFEIYEFLKDIERGLFFESTIPQGFGLGSSGALVAAVVDKYADAGLNSLKRRTKQNIYRLKDVFSIFESFFHGTSSGLDPLNCYIKSPLLIESKENIKVVDLPDHTNLDNGAIFLVNSGTPRKTAPLVDFFLDKAKNDRLFYQSIHEKFIPLTNNCINAMLKGDMPSFFSNLKDLSVYQYEFLSRMIPDSLKGVWENGMESNDYSMKLCGSGGGGYLLGFTEDYEKAQADFAQKKIEIIPVYNSNH